jgi:hypothetical protein
VPWTTLQASALHENLLILPFAVLNIYLPLSLPADLTDFSHLLSYLPLPFILLEDFSAKHILWNSPLSSDKGTVVSDVYGGFSLIFFNTVVDTYLCLASGMSSALDLAFYSVSLTVHLGY